MSQVKNHLLRAYCEPGRGEALGLDRSVRGWRGTRLIKGPDQQGDHVLDRRRSQKWESPRTGLLEEGVVGRKDF